jgi:hypothetical protein
MTPQLWTRFSGGTRNPAPRWVAGGRTTVGTVVEVHTGQSCGHRHGCNPY